MTTTNKLLLTALKNGGTMFFDPDNLENSPFAEEVESLLGGLPRTMFEDGTEQFAEEHDGVTFVYSPQLPPEELEAFCQAHIDRYRAFGQAHVDVLNSGRGVLLNAFW